LVIVVAVVLIAGLMWRARSTRRLTVEESVDRYRRTLGAVHDAAARAHPTNGEVRAAPREPSRQPVRRGSSRPATLASRRSLVVAAMAVATVLVVSVVIAANHGTSKPRTSASTTTSRPASRPTTTTTTRPAPPTTAPLVKPSGTANSFTVSKASFTVVVQTTGSQCWVDMRDPSGTALFSGTLAAVAQQSITASDVTIRLGNPAAVTISIDGTRVPFAIPSGGSPTLHFQGSAAVS
jgi:cytoskeletal protein RodZ